MVHVPDDLRAVYEAGNLVLFIGAGISAAGGLPTWKQLAEILCEQVKRMSGKDAEASEIQEYISNRSYLDALSASKHALGPLEFGSIVERKLNDDERNIPEILKALTGLKPKLHAILTTNLDRFIERAFDWPSMVKAVGDLAQRKRYIFKLHGTLLDRETWVFSQEQYDRAMFASPQMQSCFGTLFSSRSLFFVGCGLSDPNLDQTFASVRALSGEQPPNHFALMPGPVASYRKQKLQRSGIRLIEYNASHDDHREAIELIESLVAVRP